MKQLCRYHLSSSCLPAHEVPWYCAATQLNIASETLPSSENSSLSQNVGTACEIPFLQSKLAVPAGLFAHFWLLPHLKVFVAIFNFDSMGKSRITNKVAGLKRAPSGYALFCGHVAQVAAPYLPRRRLQKKQLVNKKELVLQKWTKPQ